MPTRLNRKGQVTIALDIAVDADGGLVIRKVCAESEPRHDRFDAARGRADKKMAY